MYGKSKPSAGDELRRSLAAESGRYADVKTAACALRMVVCV